MLKILINEYKLDIDFINIGGGLGVAFDYIIEKDFDIKTFGTIITKKLEKWNKKNNKEIELRIELGEFLIWKSGSIISKVNTIKKNGNIKYIGIDANSNIIQTPLLYDAYHHIELLERKEHRYEEVYIAGNLCLAGDIIAKKRLLPKLQKGDILKIYNTGAYCFSKASTFNSRPLPAELMFINNKFKLIRKKGELKDLLSNQLK